MHARHPKHDALINDMTRPLLDEIKEQLNQMGEKYEDYQSYNHTEADLEFCEAIIYYKKRQVTAARDKIANSVKRLNVIDDTKLQHGYSYLSNSRRRITKLAIRMHKSNLRSKVNGNTD